jgi:hypothetical protein
MKVQIVLSENTTWFKKLGSWIIKKSEETNFCHVSILDNFWMYESVYPKSRMKYIKDWKNEFKVIRSYEIEMSLVQYASFFSIVNNDMRKNYSLFQCFLISMCNLIGVLESYIKKIIWNGNKSLICTELVAHPIAEVLKYDFEKSLDIVDLNDLVICLEKIAKKLE